MHLANARRIVNNCRKLSPSARDIADLMLCHVENGVAFTNSFGDISAPFYMSIERMFESACKHIVKNNLRDDLLVRRRAIVSRAAGIGWGFPDTLGEIYATLSKGSRPEAVGK